MKRNLFALVALLVASLAFAQSSGEAKKLLDRTYNAYERSGGVSFDFEIASTDARGTAYEPQSGKAITKGDKFRLDTDFMTTWFDGKTQWVLMNETNEVNISNPTPAEVAAISPIALLRMYKKGFVLKKPVTKTVNGKTTVSIELVANSASTDFKNIAIAIDKKDNSIVQIKTVTKDGAKNTIDITNYNAANSFSDDAFAFNRNNYKGIEVIDLR